MKKAILAVLIPSLLGASSAFAVDIYKTDDMLINFNGDIDLKLLYKNDTVKDKTTKGIEANFDDFDFTFKYFVADGITFIAETDWTSEANKGDKKVNLDVTTDANGNVTKVKSKDNGYIYNAGAWVGVQTDYGLVRAGYQEVAMDPLGIDSSELTDAGMASGDVDGDGTTHPESIMYEHKIDNVWFAASYGYEGADNENTRQQQLAARYITKGLNFGGGIGRTIKFNENGSKKADATYVQGEVDYTWGKLRTAGLMSYLKNDRNELEDREIFGYEVDVTYKLTSKARLAAGWDRLDQDMGDGVDNNTLDVYYVGARYQFAKNVRVYGELGLKDGSFAKFDNSVKNYDETIAGILVDINF